MPVYKKINTPIDNKYGFDKNNLKPASGLPPIELIRCGLNKFFSV
jgi:hypothetical protein